MIPFVNLCRYTNCRRITRGEACWLGFAGGVAITVITFAVATILTR